jgi:hypothetical protein
MRLTAANLAKRTGLIVSSLLLLLFTTAVHTVMRPMPTHAMGGMEQHNHTSAPSTNCATLCTTAVVKRDEGIRHIGQEQDDELEPTPFAPVLDRAYYEGLYSFNYDKWPPPSKIPIYKLNGVLLS